VAEVVCQNHPVPMKLIGVKNQFGQSGKTEELMKYYELTASDIVKRAKELLGA